MGLSGEKFVSRLAGLIAGSRALPTMVLPLLGDRIQEGSPSASLFSCDAFQRRGMPHYRLEILRRASAFWPYAGSATRPDKSATRPSPGRAWVANAYSGYRVHSASAHRTASSVLIASWSGSLSRLTWSRFTLSPVSLHSIAITRLPPPSQTAESLLFCRVRSYSRVRPEPMWPWPVVLIARDAF